MRQTEQNVSSKSNEGRNLYVKAHLREALTQLLSKKPIGEISISELVDRANVSRASFYRNYECKEDILREYIDILFRELTNEWQKNENALLSEQMHLLIAHFERHCDFYKLLNETGLTYLLKDAIIGICGPKPEYEKTQAYASAYVAYTLYGWIDTWFKRGMQETADDIADMFKKQGL